MHMIQKREAVAAFLALLIAVSVLAQMPAARAVTVPSPAYLLFSDDPDFDSKNPNCWYVGGAPRASAGMPEGYWYPNLGFDAAWFGQNYAKVPADGKGYLYAASSYDMWWGGRGWSNSFLHQGRPPYTSVNEGKFLVNYSNQYAYVDGIRFDMFTQEPIGKHYLVVRAKVTQDVLDKWNSNNGLLVAFLFQYEYLGGTLSAYDSPAFTNNMQCLHFDVFFHRTYKTLNIPFSWGQGWYYTLGDKYNADIHLQYVHNGKMDVGEWYTFYIDFGALMNGVKQNLDLITTTNNLPRCQAIILRYIQVSTETIGGQIGAEIDYVDFYTMP